MTALWLCTGHARDCSNSLDCIGAGYLRSHDRELCRRLREGERMTKGGGGVGGGVREGGRIAKEGCQNGFLRKLVQ